MIRGFVGYLDLFIALPPSVVICAVISAIACLAAWGISQSLLLAGAVTVIEVAGLLLVCVVAGDSLAALPDRWMSLLPSAEIASWFGVLSGAFVALGIFVAVNASLWRLKQTDDPKPPFTVPVSVPITGMLLCGGMMIYQAVEYLSELLA